jgi:hypothetical protein
MGASTPSRRARPRRHPSRRVIEPRILEWFERLPHEEVDAGRLESPAESILRMLLR